MSMKLANKPDRCKSVSINGAATDKVSRFLRVHKTPTPISEEVSKTDMPATKVNALVLQKIDTLTKQLHNLIADGTKLSLELGPTETLNLSISTNTNIDKLSYSLHLLVDQHSVEFELDRTLLTLLFSDYVAGIPFDIIPQKLKLSVLQAVSAPLINVLSDLIDAPIELIAVKSPCIEKDVQPNSIRGQLTIKGRCAGYPYRAFLFVTQKSLPQLATLIDHCKVTQPPKLAINTLPLWLSASITGLQLRRSDIASLEKNDLIILNTPYSSYQDTISLSVGGQYLFSARYDAGELFICHQLKAHPMSDTLTSLENEQDHTSLGNIKVEVLFELARQMITLDELNQLTPGQLFELEKPIQSSVTVRANGVPVATAELVEINNHVGARITALFLKEE
jgi:type III secretion protein Q